MTDVGIAEALVGKENMLAEADVTADAIVEAEHPVCNEKHSAGRNNKRPAEDDAAEPENKARAVDNNDNGKSPEKDGEEEEEEEEIPVDDDGGKDTQDDTPMVDGNAIDDQAQKTDEDAKANADTVAEDEKEGPGDSAAKVDLKRPVKRARSAYFVFIDERRAEVQKQVRDYAYAIQYYDGSNHLSFLTKISFPLLSIEPPFSSPSLQHSNSTPGKVSQLLPVPWDLPGAP